jgi:hypothetical protein
VVLVSAVVLLVSLFAVDWYSVPAAGAGSNVTEDGWTGLSHAHWLLLITILGGFVLFVAQATRRSPAWPVTLSVTLVILGGLSTIWLLVRVLVDPPGGREFGGWLALISTAVLTWAAYESMRMEGIAPEDGPGEIRVVSPEEMAAERDPALGEHS